MNWKLLFKAAWMTITMFLVLSIAIAIVVFAITGWMHFCESRFGEIGSLIELLPIPVFILAVFTTYIYQTLRDEGAKG